MASNESKVDYNKIINELQEFKNHICELYEKHPSSFLWQYIVGFQHVLSNFDKNNIIIAINSKDPSIDKSIKLSILAASFCNKIISTDGDSKKNLTVIQMKDNLIKTMQNIVDSYNKHLKG